MEHDLRKRAGMRLKMLITEFELMSQEALAEEVGVSTKAIRNWYHSMPLPRAREVASKLGLDESYFEIGDDQLRRRDFKSFFGIHKRPKLRRKQVSFDGTTTLSLVRFIDANQEALKAAKVRIDTFGTRGGTYKFGSTLLSAHSDGYVRTLSHQGKHAPDFIGGANAVVEDHRLARVTFRNLPYDLTVSKGSTFPVISDAELLEEGSALPAMLMRVNRPEEALHYAARIPNTATFQIVASAIEENWTNFHICELAFDALKKFWVHMGLYRTDRLRSEHLIFKFLKAYAGNDEAESALAYALEALPFCTQSDLSARKRTVKLIDNIRHRRLHYSKLSWEAHFAARVANDYLPFVSNPHEFEVRRK